MTCTGLFQLVYTLCCDYFYRFSWYEPRILIDALPGEEYIILNRHPEDKIWFPDVFIDKAKDMREPNIEVNPRFLRYCN